MTSPQAEYLRGGGILHGLATRFARQECRRKGHLWFVYRGRSLQEPEIDVCARCDQIRRLPESGQAAASQTA